MIGPARLEQPQIVIIGGGVSGAAVALHLAQRHGPTGLIITVVEPRETLGAGLAYSTREPSHRVNVPAVRMSLQPDDPDHFVRWLAASGEIDHDPEAVWVNGEIYPRRLVFGRYVAEQLAPLIDAGRVRHVRATATSIERSPTGWSVETSNGRSIHATALVLAATHPPPGIPSVLRAVNHEPGFVANPYDPRALTNVVVDTKVLIVGTGLTSADTVAELDRRGHRGKIIALSRHGLRSRGHPDRRCQPFGDFVSAPAITALELLRRIRTTVEHAARAGTSWHAVFDRLRAEGPAIWSALSPGERAKLVARLRVFWDVHRFRIAPQVAATLKRREAEGAFEIIAARLVDARRDGTGFAVSIRRRGKRDVETLLVDVIVNTTGPAHRAAIHDNPALRSLALAGHIRADPLGLGIDTSTASHAVSSSHVEVPTLFVAGPLARGTFGELMGLPEVARHAQVVAAEVSAQLQWASPGRRSAIG